MRILFCFLKIVLLLLFSIFSSGYVIAQGLDRIEDFKRVDGKLYIKNQVKDILVNEDIVTVKLKPSVACLDKDLAIIRSNELGYIDLSVPKDMMVEDFYVDLVKRGSFDVVKLAEYAELCVLPNDPGYNNQWYLNVIRANNSWTISTGNSEVKVAVLDSEIDTSHCDIGYGTDDYSNVVQGYNFSYNTTSAVSPADHGTMVAGIIGAKTHNGVGIAGVSGGNNYSGVSIIPLCVTMIGNEIYIDMSIVDDAILYAKNNGARIINMSFGGVSSNHPDIDAAISSACIDGVIFVAAAGNDYLNMLSYPASNANVISVGAINNNNVKSEFSNYGNGLDVVAPGESIYSTAINNSYRYGDGTSFSAPQVSGTIALMLSINPYLQFSDIIDIFKDTCIKLPSYSYDNGWNFETGYGLLDAYAAVSSADWRIIGQSSLCDTGNFTINYCSAASVQWRVDNSDISIIEGQGTNNIVLESNGGCFHFTLFADIYVNGNLVKTLSKQIFTGVPSTLGMFISPKYFDGLTYVNGWHANSMGNGIIIYDLDPTYYTRLEAIVTNITDADHPVQVAHYTNLMPSTSFIGIPASCSTGFYQLKVRGINYCGETQWAMIIVEVGGHGGIEYPLLATFDTSKNSFVVQYPKDATTNTDGNIQLWDSNSMLLECRVSGNQKEIHLPAERLRKGMYIIRFEVDNRRYIGKVYKR